MAYALKKNGIVWRTRSLNRLNRFPMMHAHTGADSYFPIRATAHTGADPDDADADVDAAPANAISCGLILLERSFKRLGNGPKLKGRDGTPPPLTHPPFLLLNLVENRKIAGGRRSTPTFQFSPSLLPGITI